jgi:hypothetical protein
MNLVNAEEEDLVETLHDVEGLELFQSTHDFCRVK